MLNSLTGERLIDLQVLFFPGKSRIWLSYSFALQNILEASLTENYLSLPFIFFVKKPLNNRVTCIYFSVHFDHCFDLELKFEN